MTVVLYHCITFYYFLYVFYMLLMHDKWMDGWIATGVSLE